jgi:hypothetical protein
MNFEIIIRRKTGGKTTTYPCKIFQLFNLSASFTKSTGDTLQSILYLASL